MKKIAIVFLLTLCITFICNAQEPSLKAAKIHSFKAGGTPILIPPPTIVMTEIGYDYRELMEVFVAPSNRLLAAFILTKDLPEFTKKTDDLEKYAMAQVSRRGEYINCGSKDFKEITAGAKKQFGDIMNSTMKEVEEEFNRRMKSLDLEKAVISLGKPIQLGCLFSKQDAYGFGMIMPISTEETKKEMAAGCALLRVNQRLLFFYLYAEYKDEDTIKWIRKTTENWADAILMANK